MVALLLEAGHEVHFLARGAYPAVEARGAVGHRIDLRDAAALAPALAGVEAVFHVAAKAGFWGDVAEYRAVNVDGTRNLLEAAKAAGVSRFLYTSTPSVIGYGHDVAGVGEAPYATSFESPYAETKAEAERLVLAANTPGFATVALRPHLIIGPGDPNLLPRVVARAKAGTLFRIGNGTNRVDITYVDNAAYAHLDAAVALTSSDAPCAGKAYFVSNDDPRPLWPWIDDFLGRVGVAPVARGIPFGLAMFLGGAVETVWRGLGLKSEPRLTRFLALALSREHWYDMGPAKRDFGYHVRVPLEEGTRRTAEWYVRAYPPPDRRT
ncbi:MAG: NAD-dependent epimerase/dehydratase family protein [Deltaproteobacteria bacterium]|nr:NAD-dependent epimerase/dehydratase family protein [Deltaproteobacteria bacterium]